MPGNPGEAPVNQLARDYAQGVSQFADEVVATLASLDGGEAPPRASAHRRELCAAVSAAMIVSLESSAFTADERARLKPMLDAALAPVWRKHCADEAGTDALIAERTAYYLNGRVAHSQVLSAVNIVLALSEALEMFPKRRELLSRSLTPVFAHRMVGDIHHLNDVRSRLGIELSVLASLGAALGAATAFDSILRALRLA